MAAAVHGVERGGAYSGGPVPVMPPVAFLSEGLRWPGKAARSQAGGGGRGLYFGGDQPRLSAHGGEDIDIIRLAGVVRLRDAMRRLERAMRRSRVVVGWRRH